MKKMTEENLAGALAGESQAHIKYLAFADQARKDNKPNIARLFEAIAFAEQTHAITHLRTLGGVGDTAANLKAAFGGETFEIDEMYPAYQAVAKLQEEPRASRSFDWAIAAEKQHQALYNQSAEMINAGNDRDEQKIYVCPVCGHTVVGAAPDRCPVCGTRGNLFHAF